MARRTTEVVVGPIEELGADLLVTGTFRDETASFAAWAEPLRSTLARLAEGVAGREGRRRETHLAEGPVPTVVVRGLGKRADLHGRRLSKWIREAVGDARSAGARSLAVVLPDHALTAGEGARGRWARELALAGYRFDRYQDRRDEAEERLERIVLVAPGAVAGGEAAATATAAAAVADAVAFARDLANTPPNVATPEWMAAQAGDLAGSHGLEIAVLGPDEIAARKLGGLLAVGAGSDHSPRLVRLEWKGAESPRVALVGKGVTFDTGGISIKPAASMDEMKYDKAGACAVLGAMRAAAALRLPVHLVAWVPFAENMPDGKAYRPGDIVRCYNGKTVEITNTDAEGRMILADALALAAEERPDHVVELSTLTGACVVALGQGGAGLYSPDDALAAALLEAAARTGDRLWRMPLWPEFREAMKGTHADLKNTGGRWGGANLAAAFLSHFVGETKSWAHVDIAGPAYVGSDGEGPKGATGYGVALVTDWLERLSGRVS